MSLRSGGPRIPLDKSETFLDGELLRWQDILNKLKIWESFQKRLTSPPSSFSNKSTAYWANDWAEEGSSTIDGCRHPTLLTTKQICNDASSNGQTTRASNSRKETEHDKSTDVGSKSTTDLPNAEERVSNEEYWPAAIDLRQRRQEQRTDHVAKNEDTDCQSADGCVGVVKVHIHERDSRCEHRGCKRTYEGDGGNESKEEPFAATGEIKRHIGIVLSFPAYDTCVEVGDWY